MPHTITWEGRIAYIGYPTADGRTIHQGLIGRIGAPVYWINPHRPVHDSHENLGEVEWIYGPGGGGPDSNGPVFARLNLDLDKLPRHHKTLWPAIDVGPGYDDYEWTYTTILGVCLSTRPAWADLDPVIAWKA